MSVPLIMYPLDLTGVAVGNLITGESHDLSTLPATSPRAFVLNYGPFYTGGLVVRRSDTNAVLTPHTQYVATQLFIDMTLRTGLDICAVIVINDLTLPANLAVNVDYQVLGGDYSGSVTAIQQMISTLNLNNQPVLWADIIGKPVLYPPAPHLHDLGDLYGFEYIVAALERVTQAIYVGDDAQLTAIYQYIDHQIAGFNSGIATNAANLAAHLSNYSNPHRVTASQVGLGAVQNYGMALNSDAITGTSTTLYMTPAATTAAIASQVGNAFAAHVANVNNPHATTATQVGLSLVQNYSIATTLQAQAGTATNAYMTPATTAAAITQQALGPLNTHINDHGNPHATTAAQVGLGNVNNYGTASTSDGSTGTSATLYMTPAATTAAIASQVGNAFAAHVANMSNPHGVTQAQVGLGNVDNTSDINKPISTATQNALNTKITTGSAAQLGSLAIGANLGLIYESAAGTVGIRSGTGASAKYFNFDVAGNFNVLSGAVVSAGGFTPSDKRLKKSIKRAAARALWQNPDVNWNTWRWKSTNLLGKGVIAQGIQKAYPEYVTTFINEEGDERLAVDKAGMAFEMVFALGQKLDSMQAHIDHLTRKLAAKHSKGE